MGMKPATWLANTLVARATSSEPSHMVAYYAWPLVTPLMRTGLQSAGGKRIIYAAAAFANEPYEQ